MTEFFENTYCGNIIGAYTGFDDLAVICAQDVGDMGADGIHGDTQPVSNLLVGAADSQISEHLQLTLGEHPENFRYLWLLHGTHQFER